MENTVRHFLIIALSIILTATLATGCNNADKPVVTYPYSPGDGFVTNASDSSRLISCDIVIETTNKSDVSKLFVDKNHVIRDTINKILHEQTIEELKAPGIQDRLSVLITDALNMALDIDTITGVYFNSFVTN